MYYYSNKLPPINSTVIGKLMLNKETEFSLYVILPEYDNIEAIIIKSQLPKKKKHRNNMIKRLRKSEIIPCYVSVCNKLAIELTIIGIDKDLCILLSERHYYVRQILKMIKYISKEFDIDYDNLMCNLHNELIKPITHIVNMDDEEPLETLKDYYDNLLRSPELLNNLLKHDNMQNIINNIKELIMEQTPTASIIFNYGVWSNTPNNNYDNSNDNDNDNDCINNNILMNGEPINIMRKMFEDIKNKYSFVTIQYISAPQYKLIIRTIPNDKIMTVVNDIKTSMIDLMNNNSNNYKLEMDINNICIDRGNISISYPYNIDT